MLTIEQRAREFCKGAFGPLGVNIEPYIEIVADLLDGAVKQEQQRCLKAISDAPSLDENGYICEKGQAMRMILNGHGVNQQIIQEGK